MQGPKGALAGLVRSSRHFHETIVKAERMPDGILPALLILSVEREQVHDELIDLRQRKHLAGRVLDSHCYQTDVGIGRFRVGVTPAVRLVGSGALQSGIRRIWLGKGKRIPGNTGAAAWR